MKIIISSILGVLFMVIIAGIYKFNFTNDDIYIKQNAKIVNIDEQKIIYTSFYPIYFIIKSLLGDQAQIVNLVPASGEPHDYEPSFKQMSEMKKGNMVILNGLGIENYQEKLTSFLGTGSIFVMSDTVKNLIKIENTSYDSHIWLSPKVYKETTLLLIQELEKRGFKDLDKTLLSKLDELDQKYTAELKNCAQKQIVTSHNAFGYLARDYGFIQHPVFGISPEEEPSLKDIVQVIELIKKEKLKYIFSEKFVSPKFGQTIKKETQVEVLNLHPLETLSPEEELAGENYITIMEKNLGYLKLGLECK